MTWANEGEKAAMMDAIEDVMPNAAGWRRAHCPFCPTGIKKNLAMRDDSGYCYCWRCGTKSWLYGAPDPDREVVAPDPADLGIIPLPYGWEPLDQDPLPRHLHGYVSYLYHDRGVSIDTILEAGIGACTRGDYAGMVVVPIEAQGLLRGWVARAVRGKRYSTPPGFARHHWLFNQDALLLPTDEPIAVVEGVMDGLPHWPNAVACMGQPTDEQIALISQARRPVCVMLDADAQANTAAVYHRLLMRGVDVRAARLPPGTDPGNLSQSSFNELLQSNYFGA